MTGSGQFCRRPNSQGSSRIRMMSAFWSKERFGIAPFITVTHMTIAHSTSGAIVITSKDVYSSRYFDSSLGLTIASPAEGGFYLIYSNRSRASALKGAFSGLRKSMVERRVRGSLEQSLQ